MKRNEKIAYLGILTALAFGFSYVEFLIPFDAIGIPGIKLGLANLVVMAVLYLFGPLDAALVSVVRITLSWLLFGNFAGFIYSICGGVLSLAVMILVKKTDFFSEIGVSVCGGVMHNIGQLTAAAFMIGFRAALYYLPVLIIAGTLTGTLNGVLLKIILPRLGPKIKR